MKSFETKSVTSKQSARREGLPALSFAHTPYDGTSSPFTIGLTPLDMAEWIETDSALEAYLQEKDRLHDAHPEIVFAEELKTRAAQEEVLKELVSWLLQNRPEIYCATGKEVSITASARRIRLDDPAPPLLTAAKLVQEDLVLMRRGEQGWRLAAASLSFPSSWSLREKFGLPMHEIHAPVPGFGEGTRNAGLIERMFDNLKPWHPVKRFNWSIYTDGALYHPASSGERHVRPECAFLRVERQTLRKMPVSGDILFTIRIHLDPLLALQSQPNASELASSLAGQLMALDAAQLAYKGLASNRDTLVERLKSL
jgi:dimethylamine monooxygenase subunit A